MRHSVAWYVYIISLHYHDFNLTTTPTQRHLSLKRVKSKKSFLYNDGKMMVFQMNWQQFHIY